MRILTHSSPLISHPANGAPTSQNQNSNRVFDQIRPHVAANVAMNIASNMSDRQMVTYLAGLLSNPSQKAATASTPTTNSNPGFCEAAWRMRTDENYARATGIPAKFPFTLSQNLAECHTCGARWTWPASLQSPHPQLLNLLTPQFFFECHLPPPRNCTQLQGCLVCWELDGTWHEPMGVDLWLAHMSRHLSDGYVACTAVSGGKIRRRAECSYKSCPRFHT